MLLSILFQLALSSGIVLCYTLIGKFLLPSRSSFAMNHQARLDKHGRRRQEEEQQEEEELQVERDQHHTRHHPSSPLSSSHDAIHLIRLSNAFCPSATDPASIFRRHQLDQPGDNQSIYSNGLCDDLGDQDTFSDVYEEPTFYLRDSFEHRHSHRISIKPPACVRQASIAEIEPGDHKSTLSERRSSTTFAPEGHHHENEKFHRLFGLIQKGCNLGGTETNKNSKNRDNSCVGAPEVNGIWAHSWSDKKRKKLLTVRPSISALRRFNHSKPVEQVDQLKLSSSTPNRIDYINTVRTRLKMINTKRLTLKPMMINKSMMTTPSIDDQTVHHDTSRLPPSSTIDSRRISSTVLSSP